MYHSSPMASRSSCSFWKKITAGAVWPFPGTCCHAAVLGWIVLQPGRLLLAFTGEAYRRALISPGRQQLRSSSGKRGAHRQVSPRDGWGGRNKSFMCSSAGVQVAAWHRNTALQQGSSRNVFIYIKTLLYKLKERKRKKRDNVLEGQVCQSQRPSLPTLSPSLPPSFGSGATILVGKSLPTLSQCEHPCFLFKWLSEIFVFCLQRKLLPKSFFLNLFM